VPRSGRVLVSRESTVQSLAHVLWVGGPPASGKTTIATRIARRHGLRWYGADTQTWAHRDRAIREGNPAALAWEAMTPDERLVKATPAEMFEMSLEAERGAMIIDDLRSLPPAPLIIAEGSPLFPNVVVPHLTDRARAVWLIPTPEFQHARLEGRPAPKSVSDSKRARLNRIEVALLLTATIEGQARERGVRIVTVDGSRSVDELVASVENAFAKALSRGPRAETTAQRRDLVRYENEAIATQHLGFFARVPAAGDANTVVYPFACECGRPGCEEVVELAVTAYPRAAKANSSPLLAPGHGSL
jgi:hypothetical protein